MEINFTKQLTDERYSVILFTQSWQINANTFRVNKMVVCSTHKYKFWSFIKHCWPIFKRSSYLCSALSTACLSVCIFVVALMRNSVIISSTWLLMTCRTMYVLYMAVGNCLVMTYHSHRQWIMIGLQGSIIGNRLWSRWAISTCTEQCAFAYSRPARSVRVFRSMIDHDRRE